MGETAGESLAVEWRQKKEVQGEDPTASDLTVEKKTKRESFVVKTKTSLEGEKKGEKKKQGTGSIKEGRWHLR